MISDEEAASGKFSKFDHFESMGDLDRGNSQVTPGFNTMVSPGSQNSGIGQSRQGAGKPSSFIGNSGQAMNQSAVRRAGTPEIRQQRGTHPAQQAFANQQ